MVEQASGGSEKVVREIQVRRCEQSLEVIWFVVDCLQQLVADVSGDLHFE